jgi:hypothetical protein
MDRVGRKVDTNGVQEGEDESHRRECLLDRSLDHAQERSSGCRRRAGRGGPSRVATAGGVRPDGVLMLLVVLRLLMLELDLVLYFVAIHVVLVVVVVVVFVHVVVAVRAVHSVVAASHQLLLRLPLLHHVLRL